MAQVPANRYGKLIKQLQQQTTQIDAEAQAQATQRAPIGYGVFAQGLSGALQERAADPAFGGMHVAALQGYADQERAALSATSEADRKYGLFQALIKNPELAKDPRAIMRLSNDYGLFDPVTSMADAAIARSGEIAEQHKTTAEGLNQARQAGVTVDEGTVEQLFGNPISGAPTTGYGLFEGNRTPEEVAKATTAEASMLKAQADMLDAKNPNKYNRKSGGTGAGDGVTSTIVVPIPGVGMGTFKGKNADAVMGAAQGATGTPNGATPPPSGGIARIRKNAESLGYKAEQFGSTYVFSKPGKPTQVFDATGRPIRDKQ